SKMRGKHLPVFLIFFIILFTYDSNSEQSSSGFLDKTSIRSIGSFAENWTESQQRNQDGKYAECLLWTKWTYPDLLVPKLNFYVFYSQTSGSANYNVYISTTKQVLVPSDGSDPHYKGTWWVGDSVSLGELIYSGEAYHFDNSFDTYVSVDISSYIAAYPISENEYYFIAFENLGTADITAENIYIGPSEDYSNIKGYIFDASYPCGENIPIPQAIIKVDGYSAISNESGFFSLNYIGSHTPVCEIKAEKYHDYKESPFKMLNNAFYLIPSGQVYNDYAILTWDYEQSNPQNWHRKWDRQTDFYIIQNNASDEQINDLVNILKQDEYSKMTGGLFHSNININILTTDPNWNFIQKRGKTKIYFTDGIISGGIAHSEGDNGIIDYAEIGWNTNQQISANCVWHELSHTVTAGGHINYRKSVNSERLGGGRVFPEDETVFNCIYNSCPKRSN
ncbi:hypothetical protein ACFL2X_06005, partial [Candidatus Latescibacterota bacterium]